MGGGGGKTKNLPWGWDSTMKGEKKAFLNKAQPRNVLDMFLNILMKKGSYDDKNECIWKNIFYLLGIKMQLTIWPCTLLLVVE